MTVLLVANLFIWGFLASYWFLWGPGPQDGMAQLGKIVMLMFAAGASALSVVIYIVYLLFT